MVATSGALTSPTHNVVVSVERVAGQLALDVQVNPVPIRRMQQRIEQRLLRVDGVAEVTANAMGGFLIRIANGLFDLDQVADALREEVRRIVTNELPQTVRVRVRQTDEAGWWLIETDRRHASCQLLDILADALHPSSFNVAAHYSGGGYNVLVWATGYWTQPRVEERVTHVINEFYART